ncbi:uncharacterized protein N7482_001367 [Penicillium canariense]|uniref:Hydrophobin n=1 Tax=Penicillium canariense TaxID=189055 RepID=A0A9W9LTH4_9EURO|nr:uncharacterized protein N7482_001367 [Penicillium canariense]KAJ5175490.1 hypothetical protein N7482_001367 [Penicillium canariense]
MKFIIATFALVATAIAAPPQVQGSGEEKACKNNETVVCKDNGSASLLSLGNIATGALGSSCSNGNFYCCSEDDVKDFKIGLVNLDVDVSCSLNDIL